MVAAGTVGEFRLTATILHGCAVDFYGLLYLLLVPFGLIVLHILRHFVDDLRFEELGVCDSRKFLAELEILRVAVGIHLQTRVCLQLGVDMPASLLCQHVLLLEYSSVC